MIATLLQIININWLNVEGYPVRNDNETNYSYVGKGAGDGTCCPTAAHSHARWNPHARMHDTCRHTPWPKRMLVAMLHLDLEAAGGHHVESSSSANTGLTDRWPLLCGLDHRPAGDTPPEVYNAYWPDDPTKSDPIPPGKTTYLRNKHTDKYCRLAPLTAQTSARSGTKVAATVATSSGRRMLLADPSSCFDQGVLCDQATPAGA